MSNIDRRTLLYALGITSITTMLPARAAAPGKVAVAKPGENRYAFGVLPKPRHPRAKYQATIAQEHVRFLSSMHRRVPGHSCTFIIAKTNEYYVQSSEFLFKAGGEELHLIPGGSIWLPRGIPHMWANTTTTEGKLILMCRPGGFEKFFDEIGKVPMCEILWRNMG